jgi:hypothetical protein
VSTTLPCPVGPAGRAWIEARLGWLLERFGAGPLEATVVTPADLYPDGFDGSPEAAAALYEGLRGRLGLADDHLRFELYDEVERPQGEWVGDGITAGTAGHFVPAPAGEAQLVRLNRKQLADPVGVVATLAHELGHVLLLGDGRRHLAGHEQDGEPLTDLTTVFFGFGLFTANSVITERSDSTRWSVGRLGYLDQEGFAYALAVMARLRGELAPAWAAALRTDLTAWFAESQAFVAARDDLTPAALRRAARHVAGAGEGAFDDLWDQAAFEEKATEARTPWGCLLLVLAPILIAAASILGRPWLEARARPLHVVNGSPWPATVRAAGLEALVPPGGRTALPVGEGRHAVTVVTPRGEERVDAELATGWGERLDGVRSVFVLNVLGAAALVEREVMYGVTVHGETSAASQPHARPRVHAGRPFEVFRKVDDPFTTPPPLLYDRLKYPTRLALAWPGEGRGVVEALQLVAQDDPAAAAALLELHRRLAPDDTALRTLGFGRP